jgi:multisubunit Na+/H+ antiporter MnhC subunit
MLLAHVLIACGFVWIYRQGHEAGKSFMQQGLRFGAAVSLLATIPGYLIYYVVQPLPQVLVVKQIVFSVVAALIMGLVVAWLHRD